MARPSLPEMSPWNWRSLTIPPTSIDGWIRLAVWQLWMGMIVCMVLGFGVLLIISSQDGVVVISDFTNCYGPPPVFLPCERVVYRVGVLYAVFRGLCGVLLIGVAVWLLWELWSAAEPKPITDDFLKLLDDSFGRDWRNPLTWPWRRMLWAYGFMTVGVAVTATVAMTVWTFVASSQPPRAPVIRIETSESFRLGN